MTGIDSAENKKFLDAMQKKFGADLKTPNDLSVPQYEAVYLYKAAVEKAGSTDPEKSSRRFHRVLHRSARHHPDEQAAPHPAHDVPGPGPKDGSVKIMKTFKNVDPGEQCPNLK